MYEGLLEEEIKNKVASNYFAMYDCTRILGKIDFCVCKKLQNGDRELFPQSLVWAEAKRNASDSTESLVQLILTIGKAKTFYDYLPPPFLAAFDCNKIAFLPYNTIQEVFYKNDFNWNIAPSNHETREFKFLYEKIHSIIEEKALEFDFFYDKKTLKDFIKNNILAGETPIRKIDSNNFVFVYQEWVKCVKKSIASDWELARKNNIIDADFYLADLLSDKNTSIKDNLYVLLQSNEYKYNKHLNNVGVLDYEHVYFNDGMKAHKKFWSTYERPPQKEYWEEIVSRRDLLAPPDIRERKGSFFTPQKWVALSQEYIARALGENWQEEYIIWDPAAGTGNLLNGLKNKYNIYASTLDTQDVAVMQDTIKNGANLLESHVFQFDFLNDDFSQKLPKSLLEIINNPIKRHKLLIYMNPPYAEVSSKRVSGDGTKGKKGLNKNFVHDKYTKQLGTAGRELFAQFLIRINNELHNCRIANFSTLKIIQGKAFKTMRANFMPKLESLFLVPANTFDNVRGQFLIGFFIWNTEYKEVFSNIKANVYDKDANIQTTMLVYLDDNYINKWISVYKTKSVDAIAYMDGINGNDFQHNNIIYITNDKSTIPNPRGIWINKENLIPCCVYFTVRQVIKTTLLNESTQFLSPKNTWKTDTEFYTDCLAWTLFSTRNVITSSYNGTNFWIPFSAEDLKAKERLKSSFMSDFIAGKCKTIKGDEELIASNDTSFVPTAPLVFSKEASGVMQAGRELFCYYHTKEDCNINASLYDIKEYFCGRNDSGKLNSKSCDEHYNNLMQNLKESLATLRKKIEPKIYVHGFLK